MWKVYLSRWINHRLLGGKPNQMISSRVYVEHHITWERRIDCLFFWHCRHCRRSFLWEAHYEAEKKRTEKAQGEAQPAPSGAHGLAHIPERSV